MIAPLHFWDLLIKVLLLQVPSTLTFLWAMSIYFWNVQQNQKSDTNAKSPAGKQLKYNLRLCVVSFAVGNLLYALANFGHSRMIGAWLGLFEKALLGFSLFWCISWTYMGLFATAMIWDAYKLNEPNELDRQQKWSITRQITNGTGVVFLISSVGGFLGLCAGFAFPGEWQPNY